MRVSLPSLEDGSTRLRKVTLNVAFVLAILIFLPILASQFLRNPVLIEPIAMPETLVMRGMTPEVVASRLWDGLRDATQLARTSKTSIDAIPNSQRVQFSVPDVGLSMDSIVRQTRQFFNVYQTRIAGEFVCADAACAPEGMRLRLRVLRGTSEVIDLPPLGDQDLRTYFTDAAVQILSVLDPFVALSAISGTEPVRATALARRLIRQHHPDSKWAHNLIGNLHSNTGQQQASAGQHAAASEAFRAALAEYRSATELDPTFTVAQANAAQTLRQLGDPVASRAEYDTINARAPDVPAVVTGYAELAIGAGDIDGGIALLQRAAALDPVNPLYFARIGEVETERGNVELAHNWFRRSLAIDPAFPLALNPIFLAQLTSGDIAGGETMLRQAADFAPNSAEILGLHALSLNLMGDQAGALAEFERALAIDPDNFDLLFEAGKLLLALDRLPEALVRLDRAITLAPYNPAPYMSRGTALAVTGKNDAARADFERIIAVDSTGLYSSNAVSFIGILDGLDAAAETIPDAAP